MRNFQEVHKSVIFIFGNSFLFDRLIRLYEEDASKHDGMPSIKRTFFRFIRTRIIIATLFACVSVTAAVLGPVSKAFAIEFVSF